MAQQEERRLAPTPEAQRIVVVHGKLTERERKALQAVRSLEGLTMQSYCAAKAAEKITRALRKV